MSDTRQQEPKAPARDQQAEDIQPKELTKEQEDKVKGGLKRSMDGGPAN